MQVLPQQQYIYRLLRFYSQILSSIFITPSYKKNYKKSLAISFAKLSLFLSNILTLYFNNCLGGSVSNKNIYEFDICPAHCSSVKKYSHFFICQASDSDITICKDEFFIKQKIFTFIYVPRIRQCHHNF